MKPKYKKPKPNAPHHCSPKPVAGKHFCIKCGTFYLNNEATRKHFEKPCPGAEEYDS